MIVNGEMNMKKSHHHYNFCIFSIPSPFGFSPANFLKYWTLKKEGGLEIMSIHLEIYEIKFVSICVLPLEYFDVFLNVFTAVFHDWYGFL